MRLNEIKTSAQAAGLSFAGAFHPETDDLPAGEKAGTLVMLGFTAEEWAGFAASREYNDGKRDPLDRWSYRVISTLARGLSARPYFPFAAPPMPFIRWAQKAEPVHPSAMGMLIHPDYGLWRAWRGALAFEERFDLPPKDDRPAPCDSCAEKPCLTACPAGAFDGTGAYDIPACGAHIRSPQGETCVTLGCKSRRACPVGREYAYAPEQATFHMKAFRGG